jgi:hypothetical protein
METWRVTMGKKFYAETEQGDTVFYSERRVWEVRLPIYVYDMWLPIIGAVGMGVYSLYCRLERNESVKGISQAKIAKACRIGTSKLTKINEQLEDCGFIRIEKPAGHKRLMHYTTTIAVLDPPEVVSGAIKEKYQPPSEYEILTKWLEVGDTENPNGVSDDAEQECDENPNGNAKIETLGLKPLEVDPPPKRRAEEEPPVKEEEYVDLDDDGYPSKRKRPLIKYIEQNAGRKLTPNQQTKLAGGVPLHSPQHPSPCTLFEKDPLFTEYIDGKISWATGGVDGQRRQTGSLISAIRNYDHEHYGWFIFKQGAEEEVAHHGLSRFKPVEEPSEEDLRAWEEGE